MQVLEGSGLAHGPVNTIQKAFEHKQTEARDMKQTLPWDALESGSWSAAGVPVKFSETKGAIRHRPAKLGEHTNDVLREAGYSEHEVRHMRDSGVV